MDYRETEEYLDSLNKLGSVPGLDTIKELMNRLSNPQNSLVFVHIAGTNGKGSTGAFLSEILLKAGYSVGRYASPAVKEQLEIIRFNNSNIDADTFAGLVTRVKKHCEEMVRDGFVHPTRFEIETAVSFLYFYEKKCDICIVECGMGGDLDATNIISTVICSIITSVDIDHTGFLGNTKVEIASHKAGIIKPGASLICCYDEEINNVFERKAQEYKIRPVFVKKSDITGIHYDRIENKLVFDYDNRQFKTGLLGAYQPENAILAIEAAKSISDGHKFNISEENIRNGLLDTKWFGRFQIIGRNPDFVIDGAHNEAGAKALIESLKLCYPDKKIIFIIGVFKDKAYDKIIKCLMPHAKKVITINTPGNKRALPAEKLAEYIKKDYDISVSSYENIRDAVDGAYKSADYDDVITACGSLSHLGEIHSLIKECEGNRND